MAARKSSGHAAEPIKYRDSLGWRVRFAYFDQRGDAQESADEVYQATWKPGDQCVAVYRSEAPDLATLQPAVVNDPGVATAG